MGVAFSQCDKSRAGEVQSKTQHTERHLALPQRDSGKQPAGRGGIHLSVKLAHTSHSL